MNTAFNVADFRSFRFQAVMSFLITNVIVRLFLLNFHILGDHVSWHQPLDGSESRIQHMVMMDDAQLHPINTAFGTVNFVQVILIKSSTLKN